MKEIQLTHSLLRDGLQVLVSKQWQILQMNMILPITLYGVSTPELSSDELSDLVHLRSEWPELPVCFICLQNSNRAKIEQQLESIGRTENT